ncbi:hypothetical protein AURDEDRAFT_146375 [Auricularia subglabra TFB-10046 SS5]|nr:hypothetical protein AURDEDRAFT_146375 [Auricularia subglabra TFB-10046 SS5]
MLAAEGCTLDVAGSRGRTVRITKLPALLGTADTAKLGIAWLLGQLKVNLHPVWDPATKALAELAGRCGEDVWNAIWEELDRNEDMDVDPRSADDEEEEDEVVKEAERTWRCPAAANVERAVRRWRGDGSSARREVLKRPTDRLDGANYTTQLLRTLTLVPPLAEKHSRLLVPKFLALAEANMKGKLAPYLALFSKFGNPKALYRTSELHAVYLGLLAHPDRAIQRDALACVQSYKAPAIARLSDSLGGLLDETKWRDEMVGLTGAAADTPLDADAEDVLVRICYGLMTERRAGKERRAAALTLLGALGERAMGVLVGLMLAPFGEGDDGLPGEKQQLGFLAMLGDVLSSLGTSTIAYWPRFLDATLACLGAAQRKLDSNDSGEHEADDDDTKDGGTRAVRLAGLKRFADFFRVPSDFDFAPYVARAFTYAISPRLPAFDRENTQAPSALLQMFVAWSGEPRTIRFLVDCDDAVLPKTFALLAAPSVKPPVVARVLDVADRILALSDEDAAIAEAVLLPHVGALLDNLAVLVARSTAAGKGALGDLVQRQISILSRIAGHVCEPAQAAALLALFEPLLRRPPRVVSEKVKADLLKIYVELVPRVPELVDASSPRYKKTYDLLSGLFSMLRMRAARSAAAAAFAKLCGDQDEVATLVGEMNAFSVKRIEEPDFERRFNAFKTLNDGLHAQLSARQWLPVLHNLLYFVQDTDELSLRNNAAYGLRRFVDRVAADEAGGDIVLAFSRVVYPAIKRALRSAAELVRAEVLGVLAHGVEKCDNMPSLVEMRGLLAGGDEEANFFNNIAHIQVHRRSRAMRRLVEYIDTGAVCSATLSQVFVPLVSHPIYNSGTTDHLLVNEAITTTGAIAKHLSWPAYFSLVQQYLRGIKEPKEKVPVKPLVRALVSILDNFHFPMDASVAVGSADAPAATEDVGEDDEPQPVEQWKAESRIMDAVTAKLLPSLLNILENREETEDGLRIPVCVGIVRIALHLPEQQRQPQVSRLLTVIAQIFRSKSQDTRDLTRETLCKIIVMLGPDYLAEAMKQLRGALLRGPHLHILAFVTHSILVHITSNATEQFATIDDSVADIAHVAAEVIFGQSGKDVQSEDFKTKLKEVKGSTSRGMDCFALVSKCISSAKLSTLLLPVRNIMEETESAKVMLQVDDVLRRVASGLNANPQLKPTDLLIMCHTLISQNARFLRETSTPSKKQGKIHPDVAVQVKRTLDAPTNHYINNSHRFIALGLDVFVTAARRSKFDLHDPDTLSRLEPMVNVIGNTLYSNNANVLTLGLKAAAAIIKYPLKNVNKAMPVLTRQMFDVVKQAGSTESEVAQTALKTLAVLLRDAKSDSFKVKEADLTFLLDILGPDLEEHERQATVFAVLRAIVARKLMVPEIYDMMDRVAQVMVTSQSPQVQELCRGVLLQFYLDYPQGKGRLQKQMNFLAKNLSYVFESGRKSVMELLSAVFAKYDPTKLTEFSHLFFVALVMVMANDDSPTCREMAAELIKVLLQILEDSHRAELVALLQSWAGQTTKPQLVRVSVQLLGVVVDTLQNDASSYIPMISGILRSHTVEQARVLAEAELESDEPRDLDWQLPYQLLAVLARVLRTFPALTLSSDTVPWRSVVALLLFPHAWVRTGAARLLGMLYGAQPPQQPSTQLAEDHPLSASGMAEVARKSCLQLRGDTLDAQLSVQVTKNLVYVGKCYCLATNSPDAGDAPAEDEASDDEAGEPEDVTAVTKPAGQLNWLFSRLSHQARSAVVARRNRSSAADNWSEQPASILKFFAAMANHMPPAQTTKFLLHILAPVQRILDEDTIADAPMDALKALASEVQDLVQKKVGTTAFTEVYSSLRNRALNVRRERKEARALLVATNPERAARRKQQHEAVKKESRKRKNRDFKEGRSGKVKKLRND